MSKFVLGHNRSTVSDEIASFTTIFIGDFFMKRFHVNFAGKTSIKFHLTKGAFERSHSEMVVEMVEMRPRGSSFPGTEKTVKHFVLVHRDMIL